MGRADLPTGRLDMGDHRRFLIDPCQISGGEVVLDGPTARQISKVLRLKPEDAITLLDGCGHSYHATIRTISSDRVIADIAEGQLDVNEPRLRLVLASCLPKSDRIEFIIQKCTELGISEMVLVQSERTVTRVEKDSQPRKLERWRRIACEAAEQCGRSRVPCLTGVLSYSELLAMVPQFPLSIIAWEEESGLGIREALRQKQDAESVLLIIGPEGGFTEKEVEAAKSAGALCVSLGRRVLRTDTAAIAACATVMCELEGEL